MILEKTFSFHEQTCKIKGNSKFKIHFGTEIQHDCIADNEYNFNFCLYNKPIDQKCIDMSPIHEWLSDIFDSLKDKRHWTTPGNLNVSMKLTLKTYILLTIVPIHGDILCLNVWSRRSKRGIWIMHFWANGKAAVLKNESKSSELIITSCYDQNTFYMTSYSTKQITMVEIEQRILSHF